MTENNHDQIGVLEVAALLSISPATVRNWVKAGKIRQYQGDGTAPLYNKSEILRLREEITSGRSHRLKSRRNKLAVSGYVLPTEYVAATQYINLAEQILQLVSQQDIPPDPRLILIELALNLLEAKERIDLHKVSPAPAERKERLKNVEELSLTEAYLDGALQLGISQPLLEELYPVSRPLKEEERPLLRAIRKLEIPFIEENDLLGLVYMALSQQGKRKHRGSYYTPTTVVDQLVTRSLDHLVSHPDPKVIDPCCGSGNFLIKLFTALRHRYIAAGYTRREAEWKLITHSLTGYDIDPIAVTLAKLNLALHCSLETVARLDELPFQLSCRNTLETYGTLFAEEAQYDLVIGNPPWGYHFTQQEIGRLKGQFQCAQTAVESFTLFIEYGLNALKENGVLAYLLPEALLNVDIHREARRLILEKSHVLHIQLWGLLFSNVHTPVLTLMTRKSSPRHKIDEHLVQVEWNSEKEQIPQRRFQENEAYIFNVQASNRDEQIIEKMRNLPGAVYLRQQADFALGIVTGNNKAFLLSEPIDGAEPILKGSHIYKYSLIPSDHYIVFQPDQFQQVAPEHFYRAPEKLIYRFINRHLTFAYDDQQRLSLNSANIVIPRIPNYDMKYVLAVLNSRAAQFFHTASFQSVKVLRKHIESIPLPPCSLEEQRQIVDWVNQLLKTHDPDERTELYEQIDATLMDLYHFDRKEQALIRERWPKISYLTK